jgi:hypothetical protein
MMVRGSTPCASNNVAAVNERRLIEIAPHDRLLLTANRREASFQATNGEMVTVSQVDECGRVHLEDGRTIPSSYKQFDYG